MSTTLDQPVDTEPTVDDLPTLDHEPVCEFWRNDTHRTCDRPAAWLARLPRHLTICRVSTVLACPECRTEALSQGVAISCYCGTRIAVDAVTWEQL